MLKFLPTSSIYPGTFLDMKRKEEEAWVKHWRDWIYFVYNFDEFYEFSTCYIFDTWCKDEKMTFCFWFIKLKDTVSLFVYLTHLVVFVSWIMIFEYIGFFIFRNRFDCYFDKLLLLVIGASYLYWKRYTPNRFPIKFWKQQYGKYSVWLLLWFVFR